MVVNYLKESQGEASTGMPLWSSRILANKPTVRGAIFLVTIRNSLRLACALSAISLKGL